MISSNSRYVNSNLATVKKPDGNNAIVLVPSDATSYTFSYTYHTTNGAERIDSIAFAYYADPTKWWKIGDANPEILDWSNVPIGTTIRIPNS